MSLNTNLFQQKGVTQLRVKRVGIFSPMGLFCFKEDHLVSFISYYQGNLKKLGSEIRSWTTFCSNRDLICTKLSKSRVVIRICMCAYSRIVAYRERTKVGK
ncbi:hypothetical protein QQP08_024448 [Theobroma cacao]|nr:hypothetical protein QQP08_024448 [Theobroma cacao]